MWSGHEGDHLPSSGVEVKNAGSYISTPTKRLHGWCLIKQLVPLHGVALVKHRYFTLVRRVHTENCRENLILVHIDTKEMARDIKSGSHYDPQGTFETFKLHTRR
jgi:hypothetical protein